MKPLGDLGPEALADGVRRVVGLPGNDVRLPVLGSGDPQVLWEEEGFIQDDAADLRVEGRVFPAGLDEGPNVCNGRCSVLLPKRIPGQGEGELIRPREEAATDNEGEWKPVPSLSGLGSRILSPRDSGSREDVGSGALHPLTEPQRFRVSVTRWLPQT